MCVSKKQAKLLTDKPGKSFSYAYYTCDIDCPCGQYCVRCEDGFVTRNGVPTCGHSDSWFESNCDAWGGCDHKDDHKSKGQRKPAPKGYGDKSESKGYGKPEPKGYGAKPEPKGYGSKFPSDYGSKMSEMLNKFRSKQYSDDQ